MNPLEAPSELAVSTIDAPTTSSESTPLPESAVPTPVTPENIIAAANDVLNRPDASSQEVISVIGAIAVAIENIGIALKNGVNGAKIYSQNSKLRKASIALRSHPNAPKSSQEE